MPAFSSLLNLKIGSKLITAFLVIGILPFAIVSILSLNKSGTALERSAFNQLEAVRAIKKAQIESFFAERKGDMGVLVETVSTLRQEAFSKLTAVRAIKKNAIESYFQSINNQVLTFSENRMIVDAMRGFRSSFETYQDEAGVSQADIGRLRDELKTYYTGEFAPEYKNQNDELPNVDRMVTGLSDNAIALQHQYIRANTNPLGSKHVLDRGANDSSYNQLHGKVHPAIRSYLEKFGYYDIFLVEPENGKIVYSVFKELDFATSLNDGPWADTNFAEAYKKALTLSKDEVAIVDYKLYTPSYEAPAGFIASPVFDGDERIGVLVFQMPLDKISAIMGERAGLGKSGETYLIGTDLLMRSDSYLDPKNHTVVASFRRPETGKVETVAGRNVVAGKSGAHIVIDYNGNPVLSAYTPINAAGLTWGLLAEIDVAEAFVPVNTKGKEYFANYIEKYGYYDLFLMNPDGYVFYSVTHEADFQTNMVNGKYKASGLGKLTRNVLASKSYGIADFEPYAPSNNDPAAFIAQPIINNGKTEAIVALQLSIEAINHIMQQREGMGETGETYLVGSDKLMRSDSFLDPKNHSVKASFANPEKGNVDSVAARKGIEGKTGSEIVIDYNGNPVLSSYAPVKVGDTSWVLLAEIDEAEAFAPVGSMTTLMLIIGGVGVLVVFGAGLLMARSISNPITNMTGAMGELAAKNLAVEIPGADRADEIGEMAEAVQVFRDNMIKAEELADGQRKEEAAALERAKQIDKLTNDFDTAVTKRLEVVAASATQMESTAQSLSATAEETLSQATTVASAAEQATMNVQTVSSAAEELSSSIDEISRQVTQSSEISSKAVQDAKSTDQEIQGLAEAATKIGDVVSLITDIAEQTNLLALNATIEAARAGDAGKGFAVVASEVKNLANQTARATEEISAQIGGIQDATQNAVSSIQGIGQTIGEINEIATTIASAVEEQGAATQEIARNVEQAATGTQQVSTTIAGVNDSAQDTGQASSQVLNATNSLNEEATSLRSNVETFLAGIKAV